MALLKIIHYPDPVLKQVAEPVTVFDEQLRKLAADMAETMYAAPGVGLAAPQVGVSLRMVVMDCSPREEQPELLTVINPEILEAEEDICEEEGCLSVPGYYAKVARKGRVKVKFQDLDGQEHVMEAEGLWAVAFQHETDHLDGVLFIDHLSPLKKGMFRKKYPKILAQMEEQL